MRTYKHKYKIIEYKVEKEFEDELNKLANENWIIGQIIKIADFKHHVLMHKRVYQKEENGKN